MTWGTFHTHLWRRIIWCQVRCPTPASQCNKWSTRPLSTVVPMYQASPYHSQTIFHNRAQHRPITVLVRHNWAFPHIIIIIFNSHLRYREETLSFILSLRKDWHLQIMTNNTITLVRISNKSPTNLSNAMTHTVLGTSAQSVTVWTMIDTITVYSYLQSSVAAFSSDRTERAT